MSSLRAAQTRRRTDTRSLRRSTVATVATLAFVGGVLALAVTVYDRVPFRDYRTVYVQVPDIGDLRKHDPVRIGGVRIGQVIESRTTRAGAARVKLQLEASAGPVPADSRVAIRAQGLLGARFVEILPGRSPRSLVDGQTISGAPEAKTYGVPETLDVFDERTRGGLGKFLDGFGRGTFGRGAQLNATIHELTPVQRPFRELVDATLASPQDAERFLPSLDRGMAAFSGARTDLAASFAPTADGLKSIGDERNAIGAALDAAPRAMGAVQRGLTSGAMLLQSTNAVAHAVNRTIPAAPPGLRAARRLLRDAGPALRPARLLLADLRPAVPAVLKVTAEARPVVRPLAELFKTLTPVVTKYGPYGCDSQLFAATWRSMLGLGVAHGSANGPVGDGPLGPATEVRLQFVIDPKDALSITPPAAVPVRGRKDPYPAPCKYGPKIYPKFSSVPAQRATR